MRSKNIVEIFQVADSPIVRTLKSPTDESCVPNRAPQNDRYHHDRDTNRFTECRIPSL